MKRIKVSEASGAVLDWLVAKVEGGYDLRLVSTYGSNTAWKYAVLDEYDQQRVDHFYLSDTGYSNDWFLGGPIIEREKLELHYYCNPDEVLAQLHEGKYDSAGEYIDDSACPMTGPTPLIAAMRCYVVSKLGDTAEVPEELT